MTYVVVQPAEEEACKMAFILRPFIQPALESAHGEMNFVDVFLLIHAKRAKAWLICEEKSKKLVGVAVTEEVEYPKCNNLRVILLGGRGMHEWRADLDDAFCEYCDQHNLDQIEVVGRKGFARALADLGYEQAYTVLLKPVREALYG